MAEASVTDTAFVAKKGATALDDADKKLLNLLQGSFPLDPRPYACIADQAGLAEEEVLARTHRLKQDLIIRQISAIFDTRALGYRSLLVAARVDPDQPQAAARVVNAHPGVSHNYLRNHAFNLWFTIAVSPDSGLGLDTTLEILARDGAMESYRKFPTLRLFKINMSLEMEGGTGELVSFEQVSEPRALEPQPLSDTDVEVVRAVQGNLPVTSRPFDEAAARLDWPVERLLGHCQGMIDRRILRRVAAILFHRRAGFAHNGMGVWKVPQERVDELGPRMAAARGVSHCYQRPTYPDWPYSIFTMAHGRTRTECEAILEAISRETGIDGFATLYSTAEFKKTRLSYFSPAFEKWEARHL